LFLEGGSVLQHFPATDELQHLRALPHQLSHLTRRGRVSRECFWMYKREIKKREDKIIIKYFHVAVQQGESLKRSFFWGWGSSISRKFGS
jgi:hypothetical protein